MNIVIDPLWLVIETLLALTVLAFVASFSPVLYAAQIGLSTKASTLKRPYSVITGVIFALIFMLVLFQFFHLDTLLHIIGSAASALVVSTIFNIAFSIACIYGGLQYLKHDTSHAATTEKSKTSRGSRALLWFGFMRTFFSISGLTATFIGASLIAQVSRGFIVQVLLSVFFLAVALAPFMYVTFLARRQPIKTQQLFTLIKSILHKFPYRVAVGYSAIAFGGIVIIIQIIRLIP